MLNWAADHRVHHAHVDSERDPYNATKGFWWPHIGWIFFENEGSPPSPWCATSRKIRSSAGSPSTTPRSASTVALGIPLVVGLLTGRVLGCLLIGGVLRIVVSHHGDLLHQQPLPHGRPPPYSREHSARDSPIMAVLAFGEGYHNYHHSFPFDYRNGVKVWQFDPAKWMIWSLARVGLARDLRRAPEVAVLKAKVRVQFEHAKERVAAGGAGLPGAPRGAAPRGLRLARDRPPRADRLQRRQKQPKARARRGGGSAARDAPGSDLPRPRGGARGVEADLAPDASACRRRGLITEIAVS